MNVFIAYNLGFKDGFEAIHGEVTSGLSWDRTLPGFITEVLKQDPSSYGLKGE